MSNASVYTEKELLQLISEGDEAAFRKIFHLYGNLVHANIYSVVKLEAVTKDLVQDSFLRVWLYRDKLPELENFRSWLLRISYNRAFTYLRERIIHEKGTERYAEKYSLQQEGDQIHEQIELLALHKVIKGAVQKLPPQQKKIYLLSREQGMKIPVIAEQLGLTVQTVKNTLSRALQVLREAVEKAGFGLLLAAFYRLL